MFVERSGRRTGGRVTENISMLMIQREKSGIQCRLYEKASEGEFLSVMSPFRKTEEE